MFEVVSASRSTHSSAPGQAFWELQKKLVREFQAVIAGAAGHDSARRIAVPVGHGLGEECQLAARTRVPREKIDEGQRKEKMLARAKERKNAREVTCLAPSRGMREREHVKSEPEIAAKGDGTKPAGNTRSKLRLKGGEPTTESK